MLTLPPVVKNLLIINVLILFATTFTEEISLYTSHLFGLHHWSSDLFMPHQGVTYMFLHGGFFHLFFNMFALFMFGRILEQVWGGKKFLIYYMVTGIGAGVLQLIVMTFELNNLQEVIRQLGQNITPEAFSAFVEEYIPKPSDQATARDITRVSRRFLGDWITAENPDAMHWKADAMNIANIFLELKTNMGTVGASGSVFGILLAFGMLFPNTELMLLFFPVPIKAKYFVIGYGVFELYAGFNNNPADNVAHFAHLGGMLFGYLLIRYWRKTGQTYM